MIPLSFFFMAISGIGLILHSLNKIVNPHLIYDTPNSDKQ
ncbi:TRAP dicarboxylate transporter DctQ subunit [Vibrio astriarenae]|nr:TRAP dicarboxylate transporter DctQ subunit [Vibrio sp. C7]